ncbi:hypothetical protein [Candidatus Ichthyocystis hellenicum]|uniref:hypothetical protein n=1 Tax=Candidatus Ichthyocystis hellenicum TaxID=1561003 RepID=UPI000B87C00F|nr:hypothetical protein [Candidatus Ichthyocystis hellenicum]
MCKCLGSSSSSTTDSDDSEMFILVRRNDMKGKPIMKLSFEDIGQWSSGRCFATQKNGDIYSHSCVSFGCSVGGHACGICRSGGTYLKWDRQKPTLGTFFFPTEN